MERAIEISMPFKYLVKPNPMVGALIVKNGQIVSEGAHKKFGEATAVLAGNSLLTLAFEIISDKRNLLPPKKKNEIINLLSHCSGHSGIAGGQELDLKFESKLRWYAYRRLKDLRNEFTHCFRDADTIILCPIFTAGEKIQLGFHYNDFAKEIIKNSKVKLFMVKNNIELAKFLKQNIYGNKIVIGMGAGSISNWMKKLPELM